MKPEVLLSLIAVLASTATAVVGMIVTSNSQSAAPREQHLWEARTDTYVHLQMWIEQLYAWHDAAEQDPSKRELPPDIPADLRAKIRIYMSEALLNLYGSAISELNAAQRAYEKTDWKAFRKAQSDISQGWGPDMSALMHSELAEGRVSWNLTQFQLRQLRFRFWLHGIRCRIFGGDPNVLAPN